MTANEATSSSPHKSKATARVIFVAACIVLVFSFLVRETVDADSWWQAAIGRDIITRWSVPFSDVYSAVGFGRPYHDSHWLFQVIVAVVDSAVGVAGLSGLMVGIWSLTFAATYRSLRRWCSVDCSLLLLLCIAAACSDRFTPRPDIVTALMISLFSLRLHGDKAYSAGNITLLGLLQAVWTNSHGLFVIGPFMVMCCWLGEVVDRGRGRAGAVGKATLLLVVALIASVASPHGWNGWKYALLLAREAGPEASAFFKTIAELAPTFGAAARSAPDFWAFILLLLLVAASVVTALLKRQIPLARLLILVGMLAAACTGRRNIPLFALASAPFIAEHLRLLGSRSLSAPAMLGLSGLMVVLSWFPLSGKYYLMLNYPLRFGLRPSPVLFSEKFPSFFRSLGFSGQIYNSNYLGGYCLYHGIRPLTDGRWEVYDERQLTSVLSAAGDSLLWEETTRRYDIKGVLLLHESNEAVTLVPRLMADQRWRLVYVDPAVAFWMRNDRPNLPPAVSPLEAAAKLPPSPRVEQFLLVASFLAETGQARPAIDLYQRALALGAPEKILLPRYGRLLADAGMFDEAERVYQALYQANQNDTAVLNELAFLAYRRGAVQEAVTHLKRALEINPSDLEIKANYQRLVGGQQATGQH